MLLYFLLIRHWRRVAAWLVIAVPIVIAFLSVALPTAAQGATEPVVVTAPLWVRLWNFAVFTVGFQGAVFTSLFGGYSFAVVLGVIGLVLLLGSAGYLVWRRNWQPLQVWLPVAAYGLAVGLMVAVTRLEQHEPERIFLTWYTTPAITFWLAVVALMSVAVRESQRSDRNRWERGVVYVGVVATVFFGGRYVVANYNDLRHPYAVDNIHQQREDCYMRYIFRQTTDFDTTCIFPEYVTDLNQIAARRLSVYATRPPENILTDESDDARLILVETANPWINYHVQHYFLDDIDPVRIYHVYDNAALADELPEPFVNGVAASEADILLDTLTETDVFWYITREEYETAMLDVWDGLHAADYAEVNVVPRNEGFTVSEVVAVPPTLADSPRFGESIQLRAITNVSETVAACGTLTLESFWETDETLPLEYSANLVLVDSTGNGVVTSDAGLSIVGTHRWEPEVTYYDRRELPIPCELAPGTYELLFGIYYYQSPDEKLPVTQADNPRNDLAYLREITVTTAEETTE